MNQISIIIATALLPFLVQACAVGMAASGHETMDTSIAFPGSNRAAVMSKLGPPETSRNLDNGFREDTYLIKKGNEANSNRAWAHAGLDIMSLFLWELVATPFELVQKENAYRLLIIYDSNGVVKDLRKRGPKIDIFSTDPLPWLDAR